MRNISYLILSPFLLLASFENARAMNCESYLVELEKKKLVTSETIEIDESLKKALLIFQDKLLKFVIKNKKLPNKTEMLTVLRKLKPNEIKVFTTPTRNFTQLKSLFDKPGVPFNTIPEAFSYIVKKELKLRKDLRSEAFQKFLEYSEEKTAKQMQVFFKSHLRRPQRTVDSNELAHAVGLSKEVFETLFSKQHLSRIWKTSVLENVPLIEDVQFMLIEGLSHFMRQPNRPSMSRVTPKAATLEELFVVMGQKNKQIKYAQNAGKFTISEFKELFNIVNEDLSDQTFLMPKVFASRDDLIEKAKEKKPSVFNGYVSEKFSTAYHNETLDMIMKSRGFLVGSVNNADKTSLLEFESALAYAKARNMPLLIGPTNRQTAFLDEYLVEMEHKEPLVRIVTQHLDFGPELTVSALSITPKLMNTTASVDAFNGFHETTIFFNPQLVMKTQASDENDLLPIQFWSTGSFSEGNYPSSTSIGERTSMFAENRHANTFLIVEKASRDSGILGMGMKGRWHIRNAEFANDPKDKHQGFTDYGHIYGPKGIIKKQRVLAIDPGDEHRDYVFNIMERAIHEQLLPIYGAPERWIHGDGPDNTSINLDAHHEKDNTRNRTAGAEQGKFDLLKETNRLIDAINGISQLYPGIENVFEPDNHGVEWIQKYIDKRIVSPTNQMIVDLISAAQTAYGVSPYQFLFDINGIRTRMIDAADAHIREALANKFVPLLEPENLNLIKMGEPYAIGPDHRKIELGHHGHKGANGGKGSMTTHKKNGLRSNVRHTHRPGIEGGAMNPGTSTYIRLPYNMGGYSGIGLAVILVYEDGTRQIFYFDVFTQKFVQGFDADFYKEDHFTRKPRVIVPANDRVQGSIGDWYGNGGQSTPIHGR